MAIIQRANVGEIVEVYSVFGGYPLPYGLSEGLQVRVVRWEQSYCVVEREGREWTVFMMNVRRQKASRV